MAGSRELKVVISGDSSSLNKAFDKAGRSAKGFGSSLAKVGKVAAVGAAAAFVGVAVGLKKSIDAAEEAEVSQKKLQTQLQALDISYVKHGKTIDDTLKKQSQLSAFDDEDLADSFTGLVRVTHDVNKALELNALAADIARGKGIALSAAQAVVTKASFGQVGALKRQGIEIAEVTAAQDALGKGASKAAKEQAKAQDLAATKLKAINALQKTFAGQAEGYGNTAAGAQERFQVALENLGEVIGGKVLPYLAPLLNKATEFINKAAESERLKDIFKRIGDALITLKDAFSNIVVGPLKDFADWLENNPEKAKVLAGAIGGITVAIYGAAAAQAALNLAVLANPYVAAAAAIAALVGAMVTLYLTNERVRESVDNAFADIKQVTLTTLRVLEQVWDRFGKALTAIAKAAFLTLTLAFRNVFSIIQGIFNVFAGLLTGDWKRLWTGLKQIFDGVIGNLLGVIRAAVTAVLQSALAIGKAILEGIRKGAVAAWPSVSAFFSAIPGKLKALLGNVGHLLYEAGRAILGGLLDGLVNKFEAVKNFISGIAGWIRDHKGPPAKDRALLNSAGRLIIQGLQDGMETQWAKLQSYVNGLSEDLAARYGKVVDAAVAAVTAKQGALESAFDALAGVALEAFDKMGNGFKTKSEKALAKFDIEQQMKEKADRIRKLGDDIRKAQDELNQLVAAGPEALTQGANEDPAEFAKRQEAAQKQFNDRKLDLQAGVANAESALAAEVESQRLEAQRAALEKRAAQERQAHDDIRALQRRHFEEQLTDLRGDLLTGEITRDQYNKRLLNLYKRFGIPLKNRGKELGLALAEGLNEAQTDVTNAAQGLLAAIKNQLEKVEFVINVLIRDAGKKDKTDKRAAGGPVRKGSPYLVGERGPELFVPNQSGKIIANGASGGGGGGTYVFNFPNYVGDRRDLERQMQQVMRRFENSNGISFTGRSL